jgi:hypothetical protein
LPPVTGSLVAVHGTSRAQIDYQFTDAGFIIGSSGNRNGLLDSAATSQTFPNIFFSVSTDTWATLEDVNTLQVLFHSKQSSFGAVDVSFELGGTDGNAENELSGSPTGVLLAGHQYRLAYQAQLYASNAGDPASFVASFVLTLDPSTPNQSPVCNAGDGQFVEAQGVATEVHLSGSQSFDPDGDTLDFEWSVPAGSGAVIANPDLTTTTGLFPLGPTLVTLTVSDGKGGVSVCDVLVTVQDTTAPVVVCTTDRISLWPPDHSVRQVLVFVQVSDTVTDPETLTIQCRASSNGPDNGGSDGDSVGDVNGVDGFTAPVPISLTYNSSLNRFEGTLNLRAERFGSQASRVYSVIADVEDASGNDNTASCVVVVPHDRRRN